ncbi:MAG: hypothetical protein FWD71_11515 [Oscillospiraceae bacterium]|nr:hypothetical protein [Oscillospiraceae bacterium]
MSRNLEQEIDELKQQIAEIKKLLTKAPAVSTKEIEMDSKPELAGHINKMVKCKTFEKSSSEIKALLDRLENACGVSNDTGRIAYTGVFASGDRQSTWISEGNNNEGISTNHLLKLIKNHMAEKVLACIGNSDRLNMLIALLLKPRTVAEIVTDGGYSSTGQVYHHLKPLITADLVKEDKNNYEKGTYVVQPHKVQGIIMLLAGINDMVDETYSKGDWDKALEQEDESQE